MILSVTTQNGIEEINTDNMKLEDFSQLLDRISMELDLPHDAKTILYSGKLNGYDSLNVVTGIFFH